jgi:glyoxylase-like metal-dependent hydrolase (beta-lactamase superfamily II)
MPLILQKLVVGELATNCYIIGSETTKEGLIIDPADEAGVILKAIGELKLKIKYIVLTHGHPDHFGALADLKKATGAQVLVHREDAEILELPPIVFFGATFPQPPPADQQLEDGNTIELGDLKLKVIHTPGHTPGGICLLADSTLFSGDTLFNNGIGRHDLPGGNYEKLMDSLHRRVLTLPEKTVVYPGHGPETTIGEEKRSNPYLEG